MRDHMDNEQISVGVLLELLIRVLKTKMIASAQFIVSSHVQAF